MEELSPNEYVFCALLNARDYSTLQRFIDKGLLDLDATLESLVKKRFVKDMNSTKPLDISKLAVREKFSKLVKPENVEIFDELRASYPIKTPDGRRLHLRVNDCKKLYLTTVKDDFSLHKQILEALETEKAEREESNSMNYMRNLYTYVYRQFWKDYFGEQPEKDDRGRQEPGHGNVWL